MVLPQVKLSDQWIEYLSVERNLAPNTIATYRRTLTTIDDAGTATRDDVEAWWKSRAHLSTATRLNELACLRSFYKWCRRFEHRPPTDDPTHRIEPPRLAKGQPRPASRADVTTLLATVDDDLRRAVALGAYGGLRVSEAATLDWHDIDREAKRIYVKGKGSKTRLVGLSPLLLDAILPETGGNVIRAGEKPYSAATLQRKINRAIAAAGVDITFHQLRHRFGTVALASTGNLLAVSRAMGHESPATTAIYAAASDADLDLIAEAVAR